MAMLNLISLVCNATEDWTGADETYLLVNGFRVFGPESMNDGDTEDLRGLNDIPFTSSARLDLYDQDAGWFDDDDHLGRAHTTADQAGQGELELTFTRDGANYLLTYEVIA